MPSLKGRLLVATPKLLDPNFARTVVYVCSHDERGALGLILNRPLEDVGIEEHLPAWRRHISSPPVFFLGGPVETSVALGLGRGVTTEPVADWAQLEPGLSLINLSEEPPEVTGLEDLRVYIGYAGWGEGQLEGEVAEGAWAVIDLAPGDLFSSSPDTLWRSVLKRQKGELALLAFAPREPWVN